MEVLELVYLKRLFRKTNVKHNKAALPGNPDVVTNVLSPSDLTLIGGFAAPDPVGGTWAKITHRWVGSELRFFSHSRTNGIYRDDVIEWKAPDRADWLTSGPYTSYPVGTQVNYWATPTNFYSPVYDPFALGNEWLSTVTSADSTHVTIAAIGGSRNQVIGCYLGITSSPRKQTVLITGYDNDKTFTVASWPNGTPQAGDSIRISIWIKTDFDAFFGLYWKDDDQDLYMWHQGGYTSSSYCAMSRLHLNNDLTMTADGPWFYKDVHSKAAVTGAVTLSSNFLALANLPSTAKIGAGHQGGFSISGSPFGPSIIAMSPPAYGLNAVDLNNNTATVVNTVPTTLGFVDGIPVIPTYSLLLFPSWPDRACTRPATFVSRGVDWTDSYTAIGPGQKVTGATNVAGTGYTNGDVLTFAASNIIPVIYPVLTVTSTSGGVITGVSITDPGLCWEATTNPGVFTGGTGTGATFNLTWGDDTTSIVTERVGVPNAENPFATTSGFGPGGPAMFFEANGQSQRCTGYVTFGSTQRGVAQFGSNWTTPITAGTNYRVFHDFARGGSTTTIQLASGDTNTIDNSLVGSYVKAVVGTGAGLCNLPNHNAQICTAYNGTTKTMTVSPPFPFTPDTTTGYTYDPTTFWPEATGSTGVFAQLGESSAGDNCHGAVYIEGSNKWGFLTFPYLTSGDGTITGLGTYYRSTVQSQIIKPFIFIFDPSDLIKVANNTKNSWDVIPTTMEEYTPPTASTSYHWQGGDTIISSASYDSIKKELYLMLANVYFDGSWNRSLIFVYSVNC